MKKYYYIYGSFGSNNPNDYKVASIFSDLNYLKKTVRDYKIEDRKEGFIVTKNHYGPCYKVEIKEKIKSRLWK